MKFVLQIGLLFFASAAFAGKHEPWIYLTLERGHYQDGPNGVRLKEAQFLTVKEKAPLRFPQCSYSLFYCGAVEWLPNSAELCKKTSEYYFKNIPADSESEFGGAQQKTIVENGIRLIFNKNIPELSTNILNLELTLKKDGKKYKVENFIGRYYRRTDEGKGSFGEKNQYAPIANEFAQTHWQIDLSCEK